MTVREITLPRKLHIYAPVHKTEDGAGRLIEFKHESKKWGNLGKNKKTWGKTHVSAAFLQARLLINEIAEMMDEVILHNADINAGFVRR